MLAQEKDDITDLGPPVFDEGDLDQKIVKGNIGTTLVIRRSCLNPQATEDNWLPTNIFQSTYTFLGKVCWFVINAGSYENIIPEEAMQKLNITTERHHMPYKLD